MFHRRPGSPKLFKHLGLQIIAVVIGVESAVEKPDLDRRGETTCILTLTHTLTLTLTLSLSLSHDHSHSHLSLSLCHSSLSLSLCHSSLSLSLCFYVLYSLFLRRRGCESYYPITIHPKVLRESSPSIPSSLCFCTLFLFENVKLQVSLLSFQTVPAVPQHVSTQLATIQFASSMA